MMSFQSDPVTSLLRRRSELRKLRLFHPWSGFVSDRTLIMGRLAPQSSTEERSSISEASSEPPPAQTLLPAQKTPEAAANSALEEFAFCQCSHPEAELQRRLSEILTAGRAPQSMRMIFLVDQLENGPHLSSAQTQLLEKMMAAIGLAPEERSVWPLLNCDKYLSGPPEPQHGQPAPACGSPLKQEIELLLGELPEAIITMGERSTRAVLSFLSGPCPSFQHARGRLFVQEGIKIIPTHHPQALLDRAELKREAWMDLQLAAFELGMNLPPRRP